MSRGFFRFISVQERILREDIFPRQTIWADDSTLSISKARKAEPRTPPAGARLNFPSYRAVTDERPWRPGAR